MRQGRKYLYNIMRVSAGGGAVNPAVLSSVLEESGDWPHAPCHPLPSSGPSVASSSPAGHGHGGLGATRASWRPEKLGRMKTAATSSPPPVGPALQCWGTLVDRGQVPSSWDLGWQQEGPQGQAAC